MPTTSCIRAALSSVVFQVNAKRFVLLSSLLSIWIALSLTSGWSQATPPLSFENNYFVTGDYVVAGVGLRGLGDASGYAKGTINLGNGSDTAYPSPSVPAGADIVAAFLYWQTVESSQTSFQGQNGYFRGYPITGVVLGNPNAPVSWSSGGCAGSSKGSKTMRTYRADVRAMLPLSNGTIQANGAYQVRLADSGSNGGTTPLTLGATLVLIYRVLDKNVPLNAIILYDGAYAPSNSNSTMSQTMQGFYQPAQGTPVAKLTHIVGNGQSNKYEQVFLGGNALTPANVAAFPGAYNGSWDNPTYNVSQYVGASDTQETTSVAPSNSNSGCVSWGVLVFSTTVQDTDSDGLLDLWEQNQGYCDATDTSGSCDSTHPSWVPLPGANPNQKDVFVQMDYMCSIVNSNGTCDTTKGHSHLPSTAVQSMMTSTYAAHGVTLHLVQGNAIQEQTCSDNTGATPPVYCAFPSSSGYTAQPGVVGWKGGLEYLKNSGVNGQKKLEDPATCFQDSSCVRRFQHGRKDSYHYALFGHALAVPSWSFLAGTLQSISVSGSTATFTLTVPHGLVVDAAAPNGRFTVGDATSNYGLNGIYFVQNVTSPTTFTAQLNQSLSQNFTGSSDPYLTVTSGQVKSGSGYSDIGGADSLITLGLWGADGQTLNSQAGTFTHELGHSLALAHGGYYFDTQGSYVPTVEANCKPNYQSVMNYLFQVDLLGPNGGLDYSNQQLIPLNEQALAGVNQLTTTSGQASAYSTTDWYAASAPFGIGTPATRYCDGRPLPQPDPPQMFRLDGATTGLTWSNNQDVNFNGQIDSSLRGFNDWAAIDFRQIGATGSDVTGGIGSIGFGDGTPGFGAGTPGFGAGTPSFGAGTPSFGAGTPGFGAGTPGFGAGTPGFGAGTPSFGAGEGAGQGAGEISFETANSTVRPPRNLTYTITSPPRYIQLNWNTPTFGQIAGYNVYRGLNGATPVLYATVSGGTSFTDQNTSCGPTYTYFVTALLTDNTTNPPTTRESSPSNSVGPIMDCTPPYTFTGYYSPMAGAGDASNSGSFNQGKSVTAKWTLQDSQGNLVTSLNVNTLMAIGPIPPTNGVCPVPGQVPKYFNYSPNNSGPYPYGAVALYSPTTGAKGNSTFRFSTSQFVFNWDTSTFSTACYVLELDLDSGQVERTTLQLR